MSDTGDVVLAHLVGDYLIQTDWMAVEKTSRWAPALVHGATYTLPFLALTRSWRALLVIGGTHAVIDRYRLAKHLVWVKGQAAPARYRQPWPPTATGMPADRPVWLTTWLMILADNTMHLLINRAALRWLR